MDEVTPRASGASRKKLYAVLVILGLSVLVAAAVTAIVADNSTQSIIKREFQSAQQTTNFPLFMPVNLPSAYSYKLGSLRLSDGVAVFSINGPAKRLLAVTEQAKPAGYDFTKLSGTVEFNSLLGKNYVEDFDTRTTGSIVGGKTWLIINCDNPIGSEDMKAILQAFQTLQ